MTQKRTLIGPGKTLTQGDFIENLPCGRIAIKLFGKRVTGWPVEKECK